MVIYMRNHIKVMLHVNWMRILRLNNNFLRLHFNRSLHFRYIHVCVWVSINAGCPTHGVRARVGNGSCGNSLLRESNKRELNGCSVLRQKKKEWKMCMHYIHFNRWNSMDTYFSLLCWYKMWINNQQRQRQQQ